MNKLKQLIDYFKINNFKITLGLGEFVLTKAPIGQGGNGIVYEATFNEKMVAIKFLVTESSGNSGEIKKQRFISEYFNIIITENVSNIVRYIDFDLLNISGEFESFDVPVIIMVKYDSSLAKIQEAKSREQFIHLFDFLVSTTAQIHQAGIIHRDIKPENILIKGNDFYLADFGIASYNPEIFKILAETEKNERLGNRLFSAPEQEQNNIDPAPTMDIYAIGQILQWYATGYTHRGTGRMKITSIFEDLDVYDRIIDKCLENNPQKRFQSINEISDYLKRPEVKDIYTYLFLFHKISTMSFPKNDKGIVYTNEKGKIDRFFNNLMEKQAIFEDKLCWIDGVGEYDFKLAKKGMGIWKFNSSEFDIVELWLSYDSRVYNDFAFIHFQKSTPFLVNGVEVFDTAILNGTHHLSYSEFQNGFAEVNDEIIDLSTQDVERVEKQERDGYFFIGSYGSCIIEWKNEDVIRSFIDEITTHNKEVTADLLKDFARKISRNKNNEVNQRL